MKMLNRFLGSFFFVVKLIEMILILSVGVCVVSMVMVCGRVLVLIVNMFEEDFDVCLVSSMFLIIVVDLLSMDVLVVVSLVRLVIMVWKLMSVFRCFCEIFGWYGVYVVY